MNPKVKLAVIFCVYTLLVVTAGIIFVLCWTEPDSVLAEDAFSYCFFSGLSFALSLVPSVLITAEIAGFSFYFGNNRKNIKNRFSNTLLGHLKIAVVVCAACVIVCFLTEEVFIPMSDGRISLYETRARNYNEYRTLSEEYAENGIYSYALFYAEEAQKLAPESPEAKELVVRMELLSAESHGTMAEAESSVVQEEYIQDENAAYGYLQEAESALAGKDYINAHYYAEMAEKTSARDDQNYQRAKEISSVSWGLLNSEKGDFDEQTAELHNTKKEAYLALERGDVLRAYYTLRKLKSAYPDDPDVSNYFAEASEKLEKQYFFTDETTDLRNFEVAENVYFSVKKPDGGVDVIFIGGVTIVEGTGQFIQYFRDFSVTSFAEDGHIKQYCSVPYAKMTAQLVSSLASSGMIDADWNVVSSNDLYVPYIFLEAVDRADGSGAVIKPVYLNGGREDHSPFYICDIPFGDLIQIRQACSGPETMPFISLLKFAPKADTYGFSGELYTVSLTYRAIYPLVLFALMIYVAMGSFNYRLISAYAFKLQWVLLFPILTFVLYFCLDMLEYLVKLVITMIYGVMGNNCTMSMVLLSIALIMIASVRFSSAHGE